MPHILVVDNEKRMCHLIKTSLEMEGLSVITAFSGQEAIEQIRTTSFDLIITDLKMEPVDGMQVLEFAQDNQPQSEVILITAFATQDTALEAMKRGANDYLIKPFRMDELTLRVSRILKQKALEKENQQLRRSEPLPIAIAGIIGKSGVMRQVFEKINQVSQTDTAILIRGESGTGKDLIARALHQKSLRHEGPFVTINCAALPENLLESELFGYEKGAFSGAHKQKQGLFETASGGTIFLDEIGDLPLALQAKLLRVLQNNEIIHLGGTEAIQVDFRLITATHRDLEQMIEAQTFRSDLYYRINVFPLQIPPLRQRKEDIPELIQSFMSDYPEKSLSATVRLQLMEYDYPGNIRELQNIITRAMISNEAIISEINLPEMAEPKRTDAMADSIPDAGINLDELEQKLIREAIRKAQGNKSRAAELLGITRRRLYSMMDRFEIKP